jgi:hypothetical protein
MSVKHVVLPIGIIVFAILGISSCSSPGGGATVSISGNATTTPSLYATMQGTPTIELKQSGVTKYSLALGAITNGWSLSSTAISPSSYDILVTVMNTNNPIKVQSITVNGTAISAPSGGFPFSYTGAGPYTGRTTISDVSITVNADVEMTLRTIPM